MRVVVHGSTVNDHAWAFPDEQLTRDKSDELMRKYFIQSKGLIKVEKNF